MKNWPLNYVHDCHWAYGYLLIPSFKKDKRGGRRWYGFFAGRFKLSDAFGFHNCTMTGVY